jgi:alanine-synthesizing transaminase
MEIRMANLPVIASARMHLLPPYIFGELNRIKAEKCAAGIDVIDFAMGNPVDPTPAFVIEELCRAARDPRNHRYSVANGIPELRREAAAFYARRYGVKLDPETEIIATIGSKEGFSHLCLATLGPGDVALTPTPAFPIHRYSPMIAGATVVGLAAGEGSDQEVQERLLAAIDGACRTVTPRPKMVIVCSPHNPTARVFDRDFYPALLKLARAHGFAIIHDFAYAQTAFDGFKPPSILEFEGAREVACEFWTMSKPYNMAGWRSGFCVGNRDMVGLLKSIKGYFDYGMFAATERAAVMALRDGDAEAAKQAATYQRRRDALCKGLRELGWEVNPPKGGMFVWAKIPAKFRPMGTVEFCKLLMDKAAVNAAPGVAFGADGENYMRLALIESEERIAQAIARMREGLGQ